MNCVCCSCRCGVVIDAIRRKREDDPGEHRGAGVAGEPPDQQRDADAREREAGEKHQVVDENRPDPEPVQRRDDEARHDQRLGERERVPLGVEDVGVEQMRGRTGQLVRHPRQHPRHHQRIPVVMHTVPHVQDLRVGHDRGQEREQDERRREEAPGVQSFSPDILPSCRMSISSVSSSIAFVAA